MLLLCYFFSYFKNFVVSIHVLSNRDDTWNRNTCLKGNTHIFHFLWRSGSANIPENCMKINNNHHKIIITHVKTIHTIPILRSSRVGNNKKVFHKHNFEHLAFIQDSSFRYKALHKERVERSFRRIEKYELFLILKVCGKCIVEMFVYRIY